ncbi:hypothetical protein HanRHA438_Chr04g0174821 [Helianthus annuus]|nr:hypothetical protein HanRHA438_Chr04g0174821 [Helianthus annuus]
MTLMASATVDASRSSRGMVRAPGGRPFLTAGWSASGRPWNSATGIESIKRVEFPNFLGARERFMSSSSESPILKARFSSGVLNLALLRPVKQQLQQLGWRSLVRGGSNP